MSLACSYIRNCGAYRYGLCTLNHRTYEHIHVWTYTIWYLCKIWCLLCAELWLNVQIAIYVVTYTVNVQWCIRTIAYTRMTIVMKTSYLIYIIHKRNTIHTNCQISPLFFKIKETRKRLRSLTKTVRGLKCFPFILRVFTIFVEMCDVFSLIFPNFFGADKFSNMTRILKICF